MLFTGQYEHTIDAKHRLAIPAHIRSQWSEKQHGSAWYAMPVKQGLIRLYTETDFQDRAAAKPLTLTPDEDEAELQATLFGLTERLELDNAGRVRIPESLLQMVGLTPEVILIGAGDRLEIRDRAEWKATQAQRLTQLPELMARASAKKQG